MNSSSCSLRLVVLLPLALAASIPPVRAADVPPPNSPILHFFTTFAGNGTRGSNNGTGTAARFELPAGLAFGPDGTLYVADTRNRTVRKITPAGVVTTLAGSPGESGSADGPVASARFESPSAVAVDAAGNIFVADSSSHTIRRISPAGTVITYAGSPGEAGVTDATSTSARFSSPRGLGLDSAGNLYVCDLGSNRIRKISPGRVVSTLAGNISGGFNDGVGTEARFNRPIGLAVTPGGTVYVADTLNDVIRVVAPNGAVTTLAGKAGVNGSTDGTGDSARFDGPTSIALDRSGNLYIADSANSIIRRCTPQGDVTTIAGLARERGDTDGLSSSARFDQPLGVAVDARDQIFVADTNNHKIRRTVRAPVIVRQPVGASVVAGAPVQILAEVESEPGPTIYRWLKDGETHRIGDLPASNSIHQVSLAFPSFLPENAGTYVLVVSNIAGAVTSTGATLAVASPPAAAIAPPVITRQPAQVAVSSGERISLAVSAAGTAPFSIQWFKNDAAIVGANELAITIAGAQPSDGGNYHVVVRNSAGSAISNPARVTVRPAAPPAGGGLPPSDVRPPAVVSDIRITNLSIRTRLASGQQVIVGLAVAGGSRDILVRAVGPGLQAFGLAGAMSDPRLELFRGAGLIQANDNWPVELAAAFAPAGAFALPAGSRDAALRQTLDGTVSIQARGSDPGVVLLEAYDLGAAGAARLVNVSARNRVGSGDEALIAGFTVSGSGTKRLLIRAVGPTLADFGVTGTLADPVLELYAGASKVDENDNWSAEHATHFSAVGAFRLPPGSRDSVLVATLPAGAYTTVVRGATGVAGEALVEIYELP